MRQRGWFHRLTTVFRGPAIVVAVLLAATTAWSLSSISARKVYTAGQVFTAADYNADVDYWVTYINQALAKFPGSSPNDSTKTTVGAHDTLIAATAGGVVSLKSARAIQNFRADSASVGAGPVVGFRWVGTAGIRERHNLASVDTLRIVDSLTVASGAKVLVLPGTRTVWSAGSSANVPRLKTDSLFLGSGTIFNWNSGDVTITHSSNTLTFAGASSGWVFNDGNLYVGDNANTFSTLGVTLNQGANDDAILSFKSSDISHGITTLTEDDTYGSFVKYSATAGGVALIGYSEDQVGTWIVGRYTNDNTTHSASGRAAVELSGAKKSGTSTGAAGANANLFGVTNAGSTVFIVDAEGDLFADGSGVTVYDDYDDVALLSSFDHHEAKVSNQRLMESEWEDYTKYNEQDLIEMGLIGGPRVGVDRSQRGLINYTGIVRLHNGAIRQLGRAQNEDRSELEAMKEQVAALQAQLAVGGACSSSIFDWGK